MKLLVAENDRLIMGNEKGVEGLVTYFEVPYLRVPADNM